MKKKIIYGLLFAVAMVTASSSFVSCKDYEGDNYAELREENADLRSYLNAQIAAIKQCNCDLSKYVLLTDLASRGYLTSADLAGYAKSSDLSSYVKTSELATAINNNSQTIIDVITAAGFSKDIDLSGYAKTSDLEGFLKASDLAGYAKTSDLAGYAKTSDLEGFLKMADLVQLGDSVKKAYTWALYSYTRLVAQGDSLKGAYDSIAVVRQEAFDNFVAAKNLADSAISLANKALDSCNIVDAKVADLETAMMKADAKLQSQIDSLCEKVAQNEKDINNILGTLKKQISGVIIQGTYSPVFGYGSLPLGIQTNILAAYVGTALTDVQFPSAMKSHENKDIITEADVDWLESLGVMPAAENITAGQILINDVEGNAGKMYLTVNPTNVDFTGTDFKLVNSKGYESLIQLSTLEASDEVLTFGWTRGTTVGTESANGFYEVTATIKKDDALKMQPAIDKAGFKAAVMEATDCQTCTSVKDVARALYNSLEPTQRFGVKAEWQDPVVDGKRSVTSAFDIAAMSIKPLGFGFKIPGQVANIPNLKKLIAEEYHIDLTLNPMIITEYDKVAGTYKFTLEYNDGAGTIKKLDVTPLFEKVYGEVNAKFVEFNEANDDINKKIDKAAALVNSYIDRANGWISRINTLLQNVGNAVQPVLIWSDGEKAGELGGFVSANYAIGTVVPKGGQLALIPTSYSLELFAPAYKKSLIVTNAYRGGLSAQSGKDVELVDAVKALNNDIKAKGFDVFSGTSLKNPYIFNSTGYEGITFEIAYTAVDYEGKIAGRKFYLTVGE